MMVHLTPAQARQASSIGQIRHAEALRMGLQDKHGLNGDGKRYHIIGAQGELSAAIAYDMPWEERVNNFHGPDIGEHTQVRTRTKPWHDLIVRSNDPIDDIYVLVIALDPPYSFYVVGSISGKRAMQDQYWCQPNDREAAWFIPQLALKPI